jgi:membrane associated rhomboid family serine protease
VSRPIPVHDINPLRRTPWVTYALIAINVIVLLLTPVASGTVATGPGQAALCRQAAFYDRYAPIPSELTKNQPQWAYSVGYAAPGAGSVAYLAHVFGFVAGMAVGLMIRAGTRSGP